MSSFTEPIVPVVLRLASHVGITLFAPPWQDADGEDWQGFLGDGSKIILLGTVEELESWIAANPEHDLSDHPAWAPFAKRGRKALAPAHESEVDFEAVYEHAADAPDEDNVAALAHIIDMASRIADCCEDGALRSLLNNTHEYRLVLEDDVDYIGKDGQAEWRKLGDTIADSWPRAMARLETWLRWEGSAAEAVVEEEESE